MSENSNAVTLKPEFFDRVDGSDDEIFYVPPRLVAHIDDPARDALAAHYANVLPADGKILDLMSSYHSHLPQSVTYARVVGLGMNETELAENPRLTERVVHNLNRDTKIPLDDDAFDACLIAVSIQYLTQPDAVLADVARVLKPGAPCIVSYSNRCFPTKAVAVWRGLGDRDHAKLIALYFETAGGFQPAALDALIPPGGSSDPLFVVTAERSIGLS